MLGEAGIVGDRDRLVAGKQQAGAVGGKHCRKRRDEGLDAQLRDDDAVDQPDRQPRGYAAGKPGGPVIGREQRCDHARHRRSAADRQVDAAGHDHQRHAERDQREHGIVAQEGERVVGRQEIVVAQRAEHDQPDQRGDHAEPREVDVGARRERAEKSQAGGCAAHCLSPVRALLDEHGGDDQPRLDDQAAASGTPLASSV